MTELTKLTEAIQLKNYYAVAALVLTLLIQVIRKAPKLRDLWAKIPTGWRWLVPILGGAATSFVDAYNSGLPFGGAALATLGGALGIGLGAMGLNAALTESHLPWNGGAGGVPKDSRYTDTLPPPPKPPSGMGFSGGFAACIAALALLVCCASAEPRPACSEQALGELALLCRERVRSECGHPAAPDCAALLECKKQIQAWKVCK